MKKTMVFIVITDKILRYFVYIKEIGIFNGTFCSNVFFTLCMSNGHWWTAFIIYLLR